MPHDPLRVMVHHREPTGSRGAVEAAYGETRPSLAGAPGLVRHELLRADGEDGRYVLVMEWRDEGDFRAWERRLRAAGHPSPLRPYQDRTRPGGHYEIYHALPGG